MPGGINEPGFLEWEKQLDKKIEGWKEEDTEIYKKNQKTYGGRYLDNKEVSTYTLRHERLLRVESKLVNRMPCRPFRKPICTDLLLRHQREDICTSISTHAWGLMSSLA
jgi:hypothetical protein